MKLVKLIAVTLLVSTPGSAFAVGKMEKDEVREGQMICLGNGSGLKEGRNLAVVNPKPQEDRSQNDSAN